MRWIAVASNAACGLSNLLLGGAHLAGVIRRALEGKGFGGASEFHYGFPFYAVVLLGVLLAGSGLGCLWQTRGLWRDQDAARKAALRWSLLLLFLNLPLIPLQDFAIVLSATSGVNVIVLLVVRKPSM
ncbi:MAG TPA: hypothetical protein VLE48_03505 [Terriglobales bacterium]|nr:hypothetical protein [Terriglobales bacterium]